MDQCLKKNQHGVECKRKSGHKGNHRPRGEQIVAPVFTLKAADKLAPAAIQAWIVCAVAHGVSKEKITGAEEILLDFRDWQAEHGTKLPD